jgi:hypothetical protein
VSDRHAETRRFLQRVKLGGAIIGAATAGLVTAAPLLHGTPAPAAVELAAYSSAEHPARPASALVAKGKWRPSAEDALHLAFAQVGVTEDANGGGTIYQKWFVSSHWAVRGTERDGGSIGDYANANWCDMFVSWIGDQLGVRGMGADAFTPTHAQWFKDRGRWGQTPAPGAVVFFSWSGGKSIDDIDHVGLVIKDNHDGTIQTVEGNTDNAVKIRTRDVSNVVGYGYPEYGTNGA